MRIELTCRCGATGVWDTPVYGSAIVAAEKWGKAPAHVRGCLQAWNGTAWQAGQGGVRRGKAGFGEARLG